jgi:hypothetical protein
MSGNHRRRLYLNHEGTRSASHGTEFRNRDGWRPSENGGAAPVQGNQSAGQVPPGHGRCRHLDALRYITCVITHTKYTKGRLNDSSAHGQARPRSRRGSPGRR